MFQWFNNLKIGARIVLGFFIIVAIAFVIGIVGIMNLDSVQESYALDYSSTTYAMEYIEKISSHFQQVRVNILSYIMYSDSKSERDYYSERIAQHESDIDDGISSYSDILDDYDASEVETELKLLDNVKYAISSFEAKRKQLMDEFEAGVISKEELSASFSKGGEAYDLTDIAESAIQELIDYNIDYAKTQITENKNQAESSTLVMIIVLVIAISFAIALSLVLSKSISNPINKVVAAAGKLALGDMDISFDINSKDETGKLVDAFRDLVGSTKNQAYIIEKIADGDLAVDVPIRSDKDLLGQKLSEMVRKISDLIMNISNAAKQVAAGAKQISDSSTMLS